MLPLTERHHLYKKTNNLVFRQRVRIAPPTGITHENKMFQPGMFKYFKDHKNKSLEKNMLDVSPEVNNSGM